MSTTSILGLAKREVSTAVDLKQWGSAVRGSNREQKRKPLIKNPNVGLTKRGATYRMK